MVLGRKAEGGADFLLFFSFHRFGGVILAPGQLFPTEPPLVGRLFPPPRSSSSSSSWRTSITLPPPPLVFVRGGCERQATAAEERRGGVSEDSVWESRVCECGPLPPSFLPPSSRVINRCHLPAIFLFLFFFLFRLFPLLNSHHVIIIGRGGTSPYFFPGKRRMLWRVYAVCISSVVSPIVPPVPFSPLSSAGPPPPHIRCISTSATIHHFFFSLILPLSCTPPSSSLPLPFPPPLQTPGQYLRQTLSIAVAVVAGVVLTNSLLPLLPFPPPPPLLATPSHRTLPRTIRRRRFPSQPPRIEKLRNSHLFFSFFFILPLPPVDFHFHRCWTARTGD